MIKSTASYFFSTIILGLIFTSCSRSFSQDEIIGAYVAEEYIHSFDTIYLKNNNLYQRKVYNKKKELLLDMEATYEFDNSNRIDLSSFYVNLDNNLIEFPNEVNDTTSLTSLVLKINKDRIVFCLGGIFGNGEYDKCYEKIK